MSWLWIQVDVPGGSVVKNPPANPGDAISIPGSWSSPREGNDNSLQYSCLGNPMDRGAWWATIHGVTKSQTPLRDFTFTFKQRKVKWEKRVTYPYNWEVNLTFCPMLMLNDREWRQFTVFVQNNIRSRQKQLSCFLQELSGLRLRSRLPININSLFTKALFKILILSFSSTKSNFAMYFA